MQNYWLPSKADQEVLQRLIDQFKRGRINAPSRSYVEEDHQAPEVYIARLVSPGIVGLDDSGTTDSTPGKASCDIYQIVSGDLVLTALDKEVYNLNQAPLQHDWIPVVRDKWGSWLASIGEFRAMGKCTSDVTQGASGTFTLHDMYGTKGSESAISPSVTVSAYVRWGDYTANAWARLEWWPNGWEAVITTCASGGA